MTHGHRINKNRSCLLVPGHGLLFSLLFFSELTPGTARAFKNLQTRPVEGRERRHEGISFAAFQPTRDQKGDSSADYSYAECPQHTPMMPDAVHRAS